MADSSDLTQTSTPFDVEAELREALAEIERHHRDFALVSQTVHDALELLTTSYDPATQLTLCQVAFKRIRSIVG